MRHDRNLIATENMWKKHFCIGQDEWIHPEWNKLELFEEDISYDTSNVNSEEEVDIIMMTIRIVIMRICNNNDDDFL